MLGVLMSLTNVFFAQLELNLTLTCSSNVSLGTFGLGSFGFLLLTLPHF